MAKIISNGFGLELRGKAGNAVFAQTRYGLILRPKTQPKNPRTPTQQATRMRLAQAAEAWKALSPAQQVAWQAYGRKVSQANSSASEASSVAPHLLFIALASKFLQVHPSAHPPVSRPVAPFFGDGITITATGGTGQITFTASGPNSANIVTELLLQPLAHGGRAPKANLYRPAAFVPFASGSLSYAAPLAPGWYAPAFRFVNALTGQASDMVRLGAVQVTD